MSDLSYSGNQLYEDTASHVSKYCHDLMSPVCTDLPLTDSWTCSQLLHYLLGSYPPDSRLVWTNRSENHRRESCWEACFLVQRSILSLQPDPTRVSVAAAPPQGPASMPPSLPSWAQAPQLAQLPTPASSAGSPSFAWPTEYRTCGGPMKEPCLESMIY